MNVGTQMLFSHHADDFNLLSFFMHTGSRENTMQYLLMNILNVKMPFNVPETCSSSSS